MTALCLFIPLLSVSFAAVAVLHRRCLRLVARIEMRDYVILRQADEIARLRHQLTSACAQLAARTITNADDPFVEYIDSLDMD